MKHLASCLRCNSYSFKIATDAANLGVYCQGCDKKICAISVYGNEDLGERLSYVMPGSLKSIIEAINE